MKGLYVSFIFVILCVDYFCIIDWNILKFGYLKIIFIELEFLMVMKRE